MHEVAAHEAAVHEAVALEVVAHEVAAHEARRPNPYPLTFWVRVNTDNGQMFRTF